MLEGMPGAWISVLDNRELTGGRLPIAVALGRLPVALLATHQE